VMPTLSALVNASGRPAQQPLRRPALVITLALAPLLGLLLAGCSVLPKSTPVDLYQLPSTLPLLAPSASRTAPRPESLRVTRPAAGTLLAGQRIIVLPAGDRVSHYKGAQWSEPAPLLLRNRLLDALRHDGRLATLSSDDRMLQADFELDGELRAFQSVYQDGSPQVLLQLDLRLVQPATQRIVASRRFEQLQPASGSALPAVVSAFGQASDRLALQVVDWSVEQIANAAR
jgi:cholesterol transport system auxiliary component